MSDDLVQFVSDPNNAALVRALIQQHMQTQPPFADTHRGFAGGGDPVTQRYADQRQTNAGGLAAFGGLSALSALATPVAPYVFGPAAAGLGAMAAGYGTRANKAGRAQDMWMREDGRSSQYDPSMQMQPPMARAAPGEPPINALAPYLPY